MFALTRKTNYALIALCHMARQTDHPCPAREIAAQFNMPSSLLTNVLKALNHHGMVRSIRGAKGGYQLALSPAQISLGDIVTALEGPIRTIPCAAGIRNPTAPCGLAETCPVTKQVNRVHEKISDFLGEMTLAQIARDEEYGTSNRECLRVSASAKSEPAQ